MEKAGWLNLMSSLNLDNNLDTYQKLLSSYSERHRHYHNIKHISSILEHLNDVRCLAEDVNAVEVALWFHDAIYKIHSSSNELDSANLASDFLKKNKISSDFINKVHDLIMATVHSFKPDDNDQKLIVDIDLSILGAKSNIYDEFELSIRKEYRLIPRFIYNKKRIQILDSFLNRDRIYSHDYFFEQWEKNARTNIKKAIAKLS
jgi:predicted metal-dependent HD superfamily phosphohydrolase